MRTNNPLGSVFNAVRMRTDVARRMERRDTAVPGAQGGTEAE